MKLIEIYRTIQESKIILGEALDLATARKYTSIKRNPEIQKRIDSIFNKLSNLKKSKSSKRGDRIYVPLSTKSKISVNQYSQKTSTDISNVFAPFQYKIEDYFSNKATDEYDRQTKITKLLAKIAQNSDDQNYANQAKKILKKYNNDPDRSGKSSNISSYLVFSKHPYDIAGMSTDRGWTSCMNVYNGSNKTYVQKDIEEGSIICYMISSNDLNITKPIARILIKPFVNIKDESVLYVPEKVYGSPPKSFKEQVTKIFQTLQGDKFGKFKLVHSLYCDLNPRITIYDPTFTEFLKNEKVASTVDEIKMVCDNVGITNYRINEDMSIDVDGSVVFLREIKFKKFPAKFNKVSGYFYCKYNELTTLEGAPKEVDGGFNCFNNDLKSLKGAPIKVGGYFDCSENDLRSLEGAPKEVDGTFYCYKNDLKSLEGAPIKVGRYFDCSENDLRSLEGAPKKVGGKFYCTGNNLKSLKGAPKEVGGGFYCSENDLRSLEGAPKEVGGDFDCKYNDVQFTEEQVRAVSYVRGDIRV